MQILGVFSDLFGDTANMTIPQTLLISLIGFAIVFLVLGFLAVFVYLMGKVFDVLNKKKAKKAMNVPETTETEAPEGTPIPDNYSIGDLKLTNVTEEQAAVIMAIVSDRSGIPLNRLKFNSIKLLEEDKK